jgi:hypothetical protein
MKKIIIAVMCGAFLSSCTSRDKHVGSDNGTSILVPSEVHAPIGYKVLTASIDRIAYRKMLSTENPDTILLCHGTLVITTIYESR